MVLASMRQPRTQTADLDVALGALANIWLAGVAVDWTGFHRHHRRHRLALPTYPFERHRYWVERGQAPALAAPVEATDGLDRKPGPGNWLYSPEWTRSPLAGSPPGAGGETLRWLLLLDESGCGEELAQALVGAGHEVVRARRGEDWRHEGQRSFLLDPLERSHLASLVEELAAEGWFPDHLVHLWGLGEPVGDVRSGVPPNSRGCCCWPRPLDGRAPRIRSTSRWSPRGPRR